MNFHHMYAPATWVTTTTYLLMCVKANVRQKEVHQTHGLHATPRHAPPAVAAAAATTASLGPRKLRPHGVIPFSWPVKYRPSL